MTIEFIAEVWDTLASHIDLHERKDAAESLINLLVDHNYEPADIKEAFAGKKDVLTALRYYTDQFADDSYEDYSESDDEDSY